MAHASNASTQKGNGRQILGSRPAWSTWPVPGLLCSWKASKKSRNCVNPVADSFLERQTHNRGRSVSSRKGAEVATGRRLAALKSFWSPQMTPPCKLGTNHKPKHDYVESPVWGNNEFTGSLTYVRGYLTGASLSRSNCTTFTSQLSKRHEFRKPSTHYIGLCPPESARATRI